MRIYGNDPVVEKNSGGDDMAHRLLNFVSSIRLLEIMRIIGYELNDVKQMLSNNMGEFFRIDIDAQGTRGCLLRALSTMVSGNWLTDVGINPKDRITEL
jgi:hypothetical protein